MCVRQLLAADANNASDPFVTVDWDGMQQTTKVISRTLEPVWNQTLLFPLKARAASNLAPPRSARVLRCVCAALTPRRDWMYVAARDAQ
jgi:hypothetical protein